MLFVQSLQILPFVLFVLLVLLGNSCWCSSCSKCWSRCSCSSCCLCCLCCLALLGSWLAWHVVHLYHARDHIRTPSSAELWKSRPPLTPGESLSVLEKDGKRWAIITPFAHPGDTIRAKVYKHDRFCSFADLESIVSYSEELRGGEGDRRVNPNAGCRYFGVW